MTRGAALEIATLLGVLAGLLGLGLLGPELAVGAGLAAVLALVSPWMRPHLPALPWAPLTLAAVVLGLALPLVLGADMARSLGVAVLALQGLRRLGRTSSRDDRASLVLALLMLVLASGLSTSPWLLLAAVGWTTSLPLVGLLGHLEQAGPRSGRQRSVVGPHLGGVVAVVLAVAVVAFVALPRLRPADLGTAADPAQARVGFADDIALGELGTLLDDPAVALRLTLPEGAPPPTYLRGLVLDTFDGRGWRAALPDAPPGPRPADARPVRVQHEPLAGPVVFAPGMVVDVEVDPGTATRDLAGSWRLDAPPRRRTYTAWTVPLTVAPAVDRARWTALPDDLDPRITALAARLGPEADTPEAAADAVTAWLTTELSYSWAPRDAAAEDPLATFLFDRRSGHCEYFATAAAVLLRARGHPARVVNGYARPDFNAAGGFWEVRRGHAHAWVEVLDSTGHWRTVDATPGGSRPPPPRPPWRRWAQAVEWVWVDGVLAYDGAVQLAALEGAGWWVQSRLTGASPGEATPWLGLALLVGPVAGALVLARLLLRRLGRRLAGEGPARPDGRLARLHHRARRHVARAGWRIPEVLPPVAAGAWLAERAPEAGEALTALAWLHYRTRYGGEDEADRLPEARALLTRLRATLPRADAATEDRDPG